MRRCCLLYTGTPFMLDREPLLAPDAVSIRFLAAFHRFFTATLDYTRAQDKAGMLLVGGLADTLHNVPAMLWHRDSSDAWRTPEGMEAWMADFPEYIRKQYAPERLIADSKRILSAENGAQTLGLRSDLANLDLCPASEMRPYLNLLYDTCLSMRTMRNYGHRPPAIHDVLDSARDLYELCITGRMTYARRTLTPWRKLDSVWTQEAQAQAEANARIAEALLPVPMALVRWSNFDAAQFRAKLTADDDPASVHIARIGTYSFKE